jgi:hypothetical protein
MVSIKSGSVVVFAVAVFSFLAVRTVEAAPLSFHGTLSGSDASVTMDIDNDACGTSFILMLPQLSAGSEELSFRAV